MKIEEQKVRLEERKEQTDGQSVSQLLGTQAGRTIFVKI